MLEVLKEVCEGKPWGKVMDEALKERLKQLHADEDTFLLLKDQSQQSDNSYKEFHKGLQQEIRQIMP